MLRREVWENRPYVVAVYGNMRGTSEPALSRFNDNCSSPLLRAVKLWLCYCASSHETSIMFAPVNKGGLSFFCAIYSISCHVQAKGKKDV